MMKIRDLTEREQILYEELIHKFSLYILPRQRKKETINLLDTLLEEVMKNDQEGKAEN